MPRPPSTYQRKVRRPESWPPPGRCRDDHLVFLAAQPELERWSRPWWLGLTVAGAFGSRAHQLAGDSRRRAISGRMQAYVVACDTVTERLSDGEMGRVRVRGELPDWFYDAVRAEVRSPRRDRRRRRDRES